jgi:hypothetical protein
VRTPAGRLGSGRTWMAMRSFRRVGGEMMWHRGRIIRIMRPFISSTFALLALFATTVAPAQSAPIASTVLPDRWCQSKPLPAFCHAVRGVRAEGWPAQTRSEVMAQNGMVVTSQPVALGKLRVSSAGEKSRSPRKRVAVGKDALRRDQQPASRRTRGVLPPGALRPPMLS